MGLPAIVHRLLGLAKAVPLWGDQWGHCLAAVCAPGLAGDAPTHCAGVLGRGSIG